MRKSEGDWTVGSPPRERMLTLGGEQPQKRATPKENRRLYGGFAQELIQGVICVTPTLTNSRPEITALEKAATVAVPALGEKITVLKVCRLS